MATKITDELIAEWRSEQGKGMTSAVGEYTPAEFWWLLDEVERLRKVAPPPEEPQGRRTWKGRIEKGFPGTLILYGIDQLVPFEFKSGLVAEVKLVGTAPEAAVAPDYVPGDHEVWVVLPLDRQGKPRGFEKAAGDQIFFDPDEANTKASQMGVMFPSTQWVAQRALIRPAEPQS